MEHPLSDRIFGVETEFGCLVADESLGSPEEVVEAIKNHIFFDLKMGVIDLHARDEVFEPAASGGFLLNGGRLYIDAVGSHLEYATPECRTLRDIVATDRAGQRIITRAIRGLGWEDKVFVYNNSVDHFGGHTFGCHENILACMSEDFFGKEVTALYSFLVTRQIFAGVGRVGGHILTEGGFRPDYQDVAAHPIDYVWVSQIYGVHPDERVKFQLSQRADHILKTVASRVRFNRALINPKWEHFYSHQEMQRLHLLFGESNQNEYAYALKIGTTVLALRLAEMDAIPDSLLVARPLLALRLVSRDETYEWPVEMADGSTLSAVELQRAFLDLAERFRGESEDIDWTLDEWSNILDGLAKDPMGLGDRLDWVAKFKMVEEYRTSEGLDWTDDALHSIDLEYHNIDPAQSLFHALQDMGQTRRIVSDVDIIDSMTDAPRNTRAWGRSQLVRKATTQRGPMRFYIFDWNGVALGRHEYIDLSDPFESYDGVADTAD